MPTYSLEFADSALKEWRALDNSVKALLKKRLEERLIQPRVPSAQLRGSTNRYKIKLRRIGYRLVYEVVDETVTVLVLGVGRRESINERL